MTSKNSSTVLIIVVVIAAALLLAPAAISSLGNAWNKGWSDFWGTFGDSTGGNQTSGLLYSGFTINYQDGTKREIKPDPKTLSILPLTIWDDKNYVKSVEAKIYLTINFKETISKAEISGTLRIVFWLGDAQEGSWSKEEALSSTVTDLSSGAELVVASRTYDKATIESWFKTNYPSKTMVSTNLRYTVNISVGLTWSDGHQETKTASTMAKHVINYAVGEPSRIESISITLTPTRFT